MATPDTRPDIGTLPGYLSPREAAKFAELPIGESRFLSVAEEADMLAVGLEREKIADMTPESLHDLADFAVSQSTIFLGS